MPAQLNQLRRRIRTVKQTRKITKAQELVATSRIGKAQERVLAARPYAESITGVLTALASNATLDHPLLTPRPTVTRAGVLLVTSDRGLAGGYNANAIRTAEQLIARLREEGKQTLLYVIGRKGVAYYRFRNRPIEASWTGFSEQPGFEHARQVGELLLKAFVAGADDEPAGPRGPDALGGPPGLLSDPEALGGPPTGPDALDGSVDPGRSGGPGADGTHGVDELHIVSTQFQSLMTQTATSRLLAPMEVEEHEASGPLPAYEFEPDAEELLDALLPKYISTRIYAALLDSAASESASRRRAMKSASDNADDLMRKYTRDMNSARQAGITQEISEIVGGANALAAAGSEV